RHRECGHLFQGRYKALVVDGEEPGYFRLLSDYIHLNPARSRLLNQAQPDLASYPWSSYTAYLGRTERPAWLSVERVLDCQGWKEDRAGRRGYAAYLADRLAECLDDPRGLTKEWKAVRRGWYLGDGAFRQRLLDLLAAVVDTRQRSSYVGASMHAHDEQAAERLLEKGLSSIKWTPEDLQRARPADVRKQGLVWLLRTFTTAGCGWIMEHARMGHPSNISRAVRADETPGSAAMRALKTKLLKCKD
ncbi:MAG: hypothetical protein NTV49_04065, partial [Kiritimatiellaeota bacterium]|nr:hypothetical protein [Kiritimatiellota bacterium]